MNNRFSIVVYSHSDYSDCWPATFGQIKKYFNQKEYGRIFLFSNFIKNFSSVVDKYNNVFPIPYYDEQKTYTQRMSFCLETIKKSIESLIKPQNL
jgi:hypothetical protein